MMRTKESHKGRVLVLASVASMIDQFNRSNIQILLDIGYQVHVACNFKTGSTCSREKIKVLKKELRSLDVRCFQIDFSRDVMDFRRDLIACRQVIALCTKYRYAFIHCHSPIGGVAGRIAGRTTKTEVLYTAHGFHFFNGAPIKNWCMFYPVEDILSAWTDILITINREDYQRAKKKFHAGKTVYIPGVGVDTDKYASCHVDRIKKRRSLGIPDRAFLLLSVGELRDIKNQRTVIEAINKMQDIEIYYLCVGQGELQEEYERRIAAYGLCENIKLLGYREDIDELCKIADCFIHPSIREGLGLAPLEAMASGLPLITSKVNGIKDYARDGVTGCCIDPLSVDEMAAAIHKMAADKKFRDRCGRYNAKKAKKFDRSNTDRIMRKIYGSMR